MRVYIINLCLLIFSCHAFAELLSVPSAQQGENFEIQASENLPVTVFPPHTYIRGYGKPSIEKAEFQIPRSTGGSATLIISAHDKHNQQILVNSVISLNGKPVLYKFEIRKHQNALQIPVLLRSGKNTLTVELRGKPGDSVTIGIYTQIDSLSLKPVTEPIIASKDKLNAEATVTGLGVGIAGAEVEFSIQGLGTITSRSGVTDAQGIAVVEFLDFPLFGEGQLIASVRTSKGSISRIAAIRVVGAPAVSVQQSRAQIDIKEGAQAPYNTTIDFTPGVGDIRAYQILIRQTISPNDGGLTISPIDNLTSTQALKETVPVTYTALKTGTYAVTTTASVVPVGGNPNSKVLASQSSGLTVGVFKPEVDQPLFLGAPTGNPSAIETGTNSAVVFSSRVTGSNQPPAEIALWGVDTQNQKVAIGNLLDNGENGDLVKGDGFYSGTFAVDALIEGEKRYQVTAEYQNSTITSPQGALVVTSRPIGPAPIEASQAVQDPDTGQKYAPGEILVKFKSDLSNTAIDSILAKQGAKVIGSLPEVGVLEIAIPDDSPTAVREAVALFRQLPEVIFAERNILLATGAASAGQYRPCPGLVPFADINCDWAIEKVRAHEVWDLSKGAGVPVAVVDANGINIADLFHGDHVAALINQTAPDANVRKQFLGYPYASHVSEAIQAAGTSQNTIINLSIWEDCGDPICSFLSPATSIIPPTIESIKNAISGQKNILFVGIAGNHGNTLMPSLAKYISDSRLGLVVGASNFTNERASIGKPVAGQHSPTWPSSNPGSGFGSWVDIAAPGENVCVDFDSGGNCTWWQTGTSYAAPIVSGAAAILMTSNSIKGSSDPVYETKTRLVAFSKSLGVQFCDPVNEPGLSECAGQLDVYSALNSTEIISGSTWRSYDLDSNPDLGIAWTTAGFDDSGWLSATDNADQGSNKPEYVCQAIREAPEPDKGICDRTNAKFMWHPDQPRQAYFRLKFSINPKLAETCQKLRLEAHIIADDYFQLWVNGVQQGNRLLDEYKTSITGNPGTPRKFDISNLKCGENVIAIRANDGGCNLEQNKCPDSNELAPEIYLGNSFNRDFKAVFFDGKITLPPESQ